MKTVLVTGGAGYIGSIAVAKLVKENNVVVIDNLSKGIKRLVNEKAKFYEGDLCDENFVEKVFSENEIEAVMHFAGYKAVGESMENAVKYSDNLTGTINLLNSMVKHKTKQIIYSSSAGVYGIPEEKVAKEETKTNPINYYGYTKLVCEDLIQWYSKIHGLNYCILRYFNVAGDGGLNYVDPAAQNIIPIIMEVVFGKRDKLVIFGNDYCTEDGTCVRDYIHVIDLVDAHVLALDLETNEIINLGTSKGYSVKQLVDSTEEISSKKINFEYGERRKGDPAYLVASNEKAKKILGWNPKYSLKEMVESTYQAYEKN